MFVMTNRTVLVVDDSKLARMAIAKALNGSFPTWQRVEAANPDEALALMRGSKIDVALLDFNMPGRSGLVLAGELRAINPTLPLAIVSANHQEEVLSQVRDMGASFLAKPVSEANLKDFLIEADKAIGVVAK
jgi:CheY-like chemotaxis protein